MHTNLSIYNTAGKLVTTFLNEPLEAGFHETTWDSADGHGNTMASGVYFYRLKPGKTVLTKKMVLAK